MLQLCGAGNGQQPVQQAAIKIAAYQPQASNLPSKPVQPGPKTFLCPLLLPEVSGENRNYPFMSI